MTKIIAEVCQNHNGSREILADMIAQAADNGADYVKMQTIFSEDTTFRERFEEGQTDDDGVILAIKRPHAPEKERLSRLDLTKEDHQFFIDECVRHNVIPFTTIFSRIRIPFVAELNWPERVIKVASYDCASCPLLAELCDHFDHFIVSTGATYDKEIQKAAELIQGKGKKLTLLHCVTNYPNTLEMCNLKRMDWLRQFTDSVGWSDHTLIERDGIKATKAAIAMGANFVERHYTVMEKDKTKDGPISITPALLKKLSEFDKLSHEKQMEIIRKEIPEFDAMQGEQTRDMTKTELLNRDYYRGRFASNVNGEWIYNWEDKPITVAA